LEQSGVCERLEERSWQLTIGLNLIGARGDHRGELSCSVERRLSRDGGHRFEPTQLTKKAEGKEMILSLRAIEEIKASLLQTRVNVHLSSMTLEIDRAS
jgi:hypothetical protein